jgi:hypothetical protein
VIPADVDLITEAYVEQVLNALYEASFDALTRTMREGVVDAETIAIVEATTPESRVVDDINELMTLAAEGFPGIRVDPGPIRSEVARLLVASSECIFAETILDDTELTQASTPPEARTFARLLPATVEQRESAHNPTAWVIDELPATLDGSVPDEQC